MAKLFVSYSRRDSVAARKLIEAFRSIDQDVWVDWESIPPAVDWLEQIFRGIEESDAFIFLLSPDSITSEVCKVEINRAAQNNKRIIPIVLRDVHPKDTLESISKLNWTYMREADNFEEGLAKVKTAIDLDLDWLEEHRRLQVRALEWHRRKDTSLLLHGRDLRNARRMVETATSKDPPPTDLQKTYIQHSLRGERNRNIAFVATGIAVIALATLSFLATQARNEARSQRDTAVTAQAEEAKQRQTAVAAQAEEAKQRAIAVTAQAEEAAQKQIAVQNEIRAESQRSTARAQIYLNRPGELYTSTLLAIDSMRRASQLSQSEIGGKDPSTEAEEILRRNLSLLPLPVEQYAQAGKLNALALHPEGIMFVTGSADGTACTWSVEEDKISELFCTPSNGAGINAVAFNPDGSLLVTGDQAGLVQVFDSKTGELLRAFYRAEESGPVQIREAENGKLPDGYEPEGKAVRSISIRPTKVQLLIVAYDDGEIPVFDLNTARMNSRLSIANRPNVTGLSPRGTWLVAGSETGQATVWNLGGGNHFSPTSHRGGVLSLAFSPTENNVATAGADAVAITNMSVAKQVYRIPVQSPIRDIAFSPNGAWFVTGSDDHRIRVWETDTGNELLAMSQDGVVTEVAISSNGKWIASTGGDRTARLWDSQTGAEIFQIPLKASGARLAFCHDDQWLIATDDSGAITIWDISVMTLPQLSVPSESTVTNVQYSPSGEWLAVSAADKLWLLTPDPGSIIRETALEEPVHDFNSNVKKLVFSSDSQSLGILTDENEVAIYDIEERTLQSPSASGRIQSIAFTPDGRQLITSDGDGNLQAWNVANAASIPDADGFPQGSSLASAGGVLAVGSQGQIIILGDDSNGAYPALEFGGDKTLMVLSADGSRLASSSASGEVTIFEFREGQLTKRASFTKEQAASLAFDPEGDLLAVGTARNVYLMDAVTGKELARIPHISTVNGVSFSADGNYLATASSRALHFWQMADIDLVRSDDLITTACLHLYENFGSTQWEQFFAGEDYQPLCENLEIPQ